MTERSGSALQRGPDLLSIGTSSLRLGAHELLIDIDEIAIPKLTRLRGTVRFSAPAFGATSFALDVSGQHRWQPLAPQAAVDVAFDSPAMRWRGSGYFDTNHGQRPLEQDFNTWSWSRTPLRDGSTAVLYESQPQVGAQRLLALRFNDQTSPAAFEPPAEVTLPRTRWGIDRVTRSDLTAATRIVRTLEDGPFYARSLLQTSLCDSPGLAFHESLSLTRFRKPWVQALLPFRMPRRGRFGRD
jgi:carotenoid 1,2-hydratase